MAIDTNPESTVNAATADLRRQMLEWIAERPRDYAQVMEAWRTTCPRLSLWEDACIEGLIEHDSGTGKLILSPRARALLSSR